jgi:hypothetical protein
VTLLLLRRRRRIIVGGAQVDATGGESDLTLVAGGTQAERWAGFPVAQITRMNECNPQLTVICALSWWRW